MYKLINIKKFYKFLLENLKNPLFHNIIILTIFLLTIKVWYRFLVLFLTLLKDEYYFYLLLKTSIFFGILYLLYCYIFRKEEGYDIINGIKIYKPQYNYNISYLNLNKKFIDINNIYTWVHHKNNIININLSVLTHFFTILIHTNIYLFLILSKTYYHEWWYWYFMICYFLYLIDITILYLFTYNGFTDHKNMRRSKWRKGYTHTVYIYSTSLNWSISNFIYNVILTLYSRLTFFPYWYGDNTEQFFKFKFIAIIYTLIAWPWIILIVLNDLPVFIFDILNNNIEDRESVIYYMLTKPSSIGKIPYYIRHIIIYLLFISLLLLLILIYIYC